MFTGWLLVDVPLLRGLSSCAFSTSCGSDSRTRGGIANVGIAIAKGGSGGTGGIAIAKGGRGGTGLSF